MILTPTGLDCAVLAEAEPQETYLRPQDPAAARRPLVIAHRGGKYRGLEENSKEAIARSVAAGITHIEVDVRTDPGGRLFLSHGLPNGGQKPPYNLAECLEDFPQTYFRLDLKDSRSSTLVADVVTELQCLNRIYISSFWDSIIDGAVAGLPAFVPRALGIRGGTARAVRALIAQPNSADESHEARLAYHAHVHLLRQPTLARRIFDSLHSGGVEVHVWTVNRVEDVRLCLQLGADGLLTDEPAIVKEAILAVGHSD